MNLIIRLLKTLLRYLLRPSRIGLLDCASISFRVWPNDLDTNLHMNNGRFLTLMDLGRLDLLLHLGLARPAFRRGWAPVLAGSQIRFRRPLALWDRFTISTRILGWDAKWVFLEQCIECRGKPVLTAWLKGAFSHGGKAVPLAEVFAVLGQEASKTLSPPLAPALLQWVEAEEAMAASTGTARHPFKGAGRSRLPL